MELGSTDYRNLHHLQNNAPMTNLDLAEAFGLSPAPCLKRVKALEAGGVIKCYAGIVDAGAVGLQYRTTAAGTRLARNLIGR